MLCASSAWAYTRIVDVSIKQPKLLAALRVVARAAKGATSLMPVQSHVLIRAELDESGTSLSASSGVVALRADVEMDIAEPGAVCVPATELLNIVKELNSDASVRICTEPLSHSEARSHAEARKVRLLSGTLVHRLNGLASRVFPKEADATSVQWAVFDAEALVSALAKCLPHVGRDESRVALTGVCIERAADRVVMVATDGHRLKVTNCRTTFEGVESKVGDQWLAPRQGLAELMSVLKVAKNVERVRVGFTDSVMVASVEGVHVQATLTESAYPNWRAIVPAPSGGRAAFEVIRGALMKAVSRVTAAARREDVQLKLSVTNNVMSLRYSSSADAVDQIDVFSVGEQGGNAEVGINYRLLLDALAATDTDDAIISIDGLAPVMVEPRQEVTDDEMAIIMPMRLS